MTEQKTYTYCLPDKGGVPTAYETGSNAVVIVGANGSGKSKLGTWMKYQDAESACRIAPPMISREEHEAALAALFARRDAEVQQFFAQCRAAEEQGLPQPRTPRTVLDKLYDVWDVVFPRRALREEGASFMVIPDTNGEGAAYSADQMSDGERSVLYLACKVLCVDEGKQIIIDEPEAHLHSSLMGHLCLALEKARQDCLFVFITHEVQFAALHAGSDKVWVKAFDGRAWEWEFIPDSNLPDQLLLELLGNQKNVLFIEGSKNSLDIQLYSVLYPHCYVVPCGGCSQVISNTLAFASTVELHGYKAYGLIDRDYRTDEELKDLANRGIYSLGVAEVENLFLVEPLLHEVAKRFGCEEPETVVRSVQDYVINTRFKGQLGRQVCQAIISSLKAQLNAIEIDGLESAEVSDRFKSEVCALSPAEELAKQEARFGGALEFGDYDAVLRLFNAKDVAKNVGHFFGMDNRAYCSKVIALLAAEDNESLVAALKPYVPDLM